MNRFTIPRSVVGETTIRQTSVSYLVLLTVFIVNVLAEALLLDGFLVFLDVYHKLFIVATAWCCGVFTPITGYVYAVNVLEPYTTITGGCNNSELDKCTVPTTGRDEDVTYFEFFNLSSGVGGFGEVVNGCHDVYFLSVEGFSCHY